MRSGTMAKTGLRQIKPFTDLHMPSITTTILSRKLT
jgi:hypothetical protein